MRPKGEVYILPTENKELHKARQIDGKRFMYRSIYLSKSAADGAADAHRARGTLVRVLPRQVWIKKAGYELGIDKVQGYVLYVHYTEERRERKHTGCMRHTCNKSQSDPTFSKEWSGVSGAPHARGKHCPDCGEQLHSEAGSFYCPRCDNY